MQDITEAIEEINRIYTLLLFDPDNTDLISQLRIAVDVLAVLLMDK